MLSAHEQKINSGWVLYYNEDGYPYYYNELTGESEWAEYEEYTETQANEYTENDGDEDYEDEEDSEEEVDDEEDNDEEDEDESDDESDEESKAQREQRIFDKIMEQKFLEYLKTPEGIAAAQAELERVGRKVDKRLAKKSSLVEQEYVRSLKSKKKETNIPANTIFGKLIETTNAWMFPPAEDKSVSSKTSGQGSGKHKKSSNGKFDDYNRETKQRHAGGSTSAGNLAAVEAGTGGRGRQPTRGSPSSSRSSSLSSDTGSFSSEDSDVAEIDAPLFSEVPASWFSLASLTRLLTAFQTPTVVPGNANTTNTAERGGGASSSSATSTALATTNPAQPFLPESCVVAAEQSFTVVGGAFVQGFGLLFERLNPMLESFVNSILDAQATGPPNSRQAQRRMVAAAVSAAGNAQNQDSRQDYSNLPPAPPSRVPTSARGPPNHTPRGGVRPSPRVGVTGPAYSLPTAPPPVSRSRQSTPRMQAPTPRSTIGEAIDTSAQIDPPVPPPSAALPAAPPLPVTLESEGELRTAEQGSASLDAELISDTDISMEDVPLTETAVGENSLAVPNAPVERSRDESPDSPAEEGPEEASKVIEEKEAEEVEVQRETDSEPASPEEEERRYPDMPPAEEFSEDPSHADHLLVLALHSQDEQQLEADGPAIHVTEASLNNEVAGVYPESCEMQEPAVANADSSGSQTEHASTPVVEDSVLDSNRSNDGTLQLDEDDVAVPTNIAEQEKPFDGDAMPDAPIDLADKTVTASALEDDNAPIAEADKHHL